MVIEGLSHHGDHTGQPRLLGSVHGEDRLGGDHHKGQATDIVGRNAARGGIRHKRMERPLNVKTNINGRGVDPMLVPRPSFYGCHTSLNRLRYRGLHCRSMRRPDAFWPWPGVQQQHQHRSEHEDNQDPIYCGKVCSPAVTALLLEGRLPVHGHELRNLSNRNKSTKDLRLMETLRQLRRSPVQVTRLAIDSETRWRRRLSMILTPVLMTPSLINV